MHAIYPLMQGIKSQRMQQLILLYEEHHDLYSLTPGSSHNHQAWAGGYLDHIAECLRINAVTYQALSSIRPLPFTLESAAVCLLLHDIEKPYKYGDSDDPRVNIWLPENQEDASKGYWESIKLDLIRDLRDAYGFRLSKGEWNAIEYTHGEGDDYRSDKRISNELAAHVGNCDRTSARIWHNKGPHNP